MRRKIWWFIPPFLVAVIVILFLATREEPPTREVMDAEQAVEEAKKKEADLYAQDILSRAEESLKKSKDLLRDKKYKEAKLAAHEAANFAREAMAQVEPNKARMKTEIELTISEISKKIEELKRLVSKSPPQMAPRERKDLGELIQKWEKSISSIDSLIKEEKIRQAHDQLMALKKEVESKAEGLIPSPEERFGIK